MTIYLSRAFRRSNSSLFLCSGKAVQSEVLRLSSERFLVDAGLGTARICMQDESTGVPINRATRFENKVGYMDVVGSESRIKKSILVRLFRKIVGGESRIKKRAAAQEFNWAGSTDVVAGDNSLLLPQRFRQKRAGMELTKIWRRNRTVKGFFLEKVEKGYSVAIAGFITYLPCSDLRIFQKKGQGLRFIIRNLKHKRMNIVVFISDGKDAKCQRKK